MIRIRVGHGRRAGLVDGQVAVVVDAVTTLLGDAGAAHRGGIVAVGVDVVHVVDQHVAGGPGEGAHVRGTARVRTGAGVGLHLREDVREGVGLAGVAVGVEVHAVDLRPLVGIGDFIAVDVEVDGFAGREARRRIAGDALGRGLGVVEVAEGGVGGGILVASGQEEEREGSEELEGHGVLLEH